MFDIYLTLGNAEITMGTFFFIHLDTKEGEFVEQAVQTAQGANETAEYAVDKYTAYDDADHQQEFPGEQRAEHPEGTVVDLVGKQQQAAFNDASGADVFAEGGGRGFVNGVCNGNHHCEEYQDHILHIREDPGDGALLHLGRFDFVQQILDQAEGTQPTADHSAEDNGIEHHDAEGIEERTFTIIKGTLQRTQGAGTDGTGAGVTVDAGGAEELGAGGYRENTAGNEALDVGVEQQREVQLHQSTLGGQILVDKCFDLAHVITPIQYIRCRWQRPWQRWLPCRRWLRQWRSALRSIPKCRSG